MGHTKKHLQAFSSVVISGQAFSLQKKIDPRVWNIWSAQNSWELICMATSWTLVSTGKPGTDDYAKYRFHFYYHFQIWLDL